MKSNSFLFNYFTYRPSVANFFKQIQFYENRILNEINLKSIRIESVMPYESVVSHVHMTFIFDRVKDFNNFMLSISQEFFVHFNT